MCVVFNFVILCSFASSYSFKILFCFLTEALKSTSFVGGVWSW